MADSTAEPALGVDPLKAQHQSWGAEFIQPVINALYRGQLEEAQLLNGKASLALEAADLDEGVCEALGYMVLFLHHNIRWQRNPEEWNRENYFDVRRLFEQPGVTVMGDLERVRRLITIRYHADADGLEPLSEEALLAMIDSLNGEPDDTVWFYAAGWGFQHNCLSILERAYTEVLINPANWLIQAKWQRINIMYLLLAGRASRRDVEETVKLLTVLPQLEEFESIIWPRCKDAGLVDDALEGMLHGRSAMIRSNTPVPQGNERRTQRMRGD